MPKLNTTIFIKGPDQSQIFTPEDELPDWAVEQLEKDGTKGVFAEDSEEPNINDAAGRPLDNQLAAVEEERDGLAEQVRALRAQLADRDAADPTQGQSVQTGLVGVEYEDIKAEKLKDLAKDRGIDIDGKSAPEIANALREADASTSGQ